MLSFILGSKEDDTIKSKRNKTPAAPRTPEEKALTAERRILRLSCISNIMFVLVEIVFALTSRSQSVLMDAAYDGAEMVVIALTLFLTPLFYQPISEKRPFGYGQVESVFTAFKSLMLISVMLGLSFNVIQVMLSGGRRVNYGGVAIFQLAAALVSLVILLVMYGWNTKYASPTVRAELLGWRLDVAYSTGLAIAFFLAKLLEGTSLRWLSPYFDQIVAFLVVGFSLPDAVRLLREAVRDIFLFAPDEETTQKIKDICTPIMEEYGFTPVFFDITHTGRRLWIAVYFSMEANTLSADLLWKVTDLVNHALDQVLGANTCELLLAPPEPTAACPVEISDT